MKAMAEFAVMGSSATVMTGEEFGRGATKGDVWPLITIAEADGANEIVESEMTMAGEPGARVWEPMTMSEPTALAVGAAGPWLLLNAPAMIAPRSSEEDGDGGDGSLPPESGLEFAGSDGSVPGDPSPEPEFGDASGCGVGSAPGAS